MGHGRAEEAGPSLAWDAEKASAGNGRAQSSVPTFMERRKYIKIPLHAIFQHTVRRSLKTQPPPNFHHAFTITFKMSVRLV